MTARCTAPGKPRSLPTLTPLGQLQLNQKLNNSPRFQYDNVFEFGVMTRFPTVAQAEKAALDGRNESQDSQAILDALKAEFGVGTVRIEIRDQQIAPRRLARLLTV